MGGLRLFRVLAPCLALGAPAGAGPVINEFVTRPRAGEGEWIEILNAGSGALDLTGWSVRDGTGTGRTIANAPSVPGRGLLVLASRPESLRAAFRLPDSVVVVRPDGWPVLNDRDASGGGPADVIVLVDGAGTPVDSVAYYEVWLPPEAGRSLERVDGAVPGHEAAAWGWSVDGEGATPGRRNSLLPPDEAAGEPGVWSGPEFVSPAKRPGVFSYRMGEPGTLGITLVDEEGRILAVLQPPLPVSGTGQWVWGPGAFLPAHPGDVYLCLLWQGATARPVRRCLRVWVSP
jgi:hypothetical protein